MAAPSLAPFTTSAPSSQPSHRCARTLPPKNSRILSIDGRRACGPRPSSAAPSPPPQRQVSPTHAPSFEPTDGGDGSGSESSSAGLDLVAVGAGVALGAIAVLCCCVAILSYKVLAKPNRPVVWHIYGQVALRPPPRVYRCMAKGATASRTPP